jgi:hypothetical protein
MKSGISSQIRIFRQIGDVKGTAQNTKQKRQSNNEVNELVIQDRLICASIAASVFWSDTSKLGSASDCDGHAVHQKEAQLIEILGLILNVRNGRSSNNRNGSRVSVAREKQAEEVMTIDRIGKTWRMIFGSCMTSA